MNELGVIQVGDGAAIVAIQNGDGLAAAVTQIGPGALTITQTMGARP
jgi:hypothetical protein